MKTTIHFAFFLIINTVFAQSPIAVIGTAVEGWTEDVDLNSYSNMMYPDQAGDYNYFGIELIDGYVKFVEVDNQDNVFGGTSFPSGEFSEDDIIVSAGLYTIELNMSDNTYFFDVYPKVFFGYSQTVLFESDDLVNFALPASEFTSGYRFIHAHTHPGLLEYDEYGSNNFPSGIGNEYHPIPIEAGYYKVFFNFATLFYSFEPPAVSIVGTALNGWPSEVGESADVFMESEDGFIYTLSSVFLEEGELKFREDSSWAVSWSGTNFPVGDLVDSDLDAIVIPQSGYYDVVFNRQNQTYSFTTLSSSNFTSNQIEIYPNPSRELWHFSFGNYDVAQIQLYTITGELVFDTKRDLSKKGFKIDASSYSEGLYLAKIISNSGKMVTVKLIKE